MQGRIASFERENPSEFIVIFTLELEGIVTE